jgi:hypothetical protein
VNEFHRGQEQACRALWRAVILNALCERAYRGRRRQKLAWQRDARRWLVASNPHFRSVCALAGVDPVSVAGAVYDFDIATPKWEHLIEQVRLLSRDQG